MSEINPRQIAFARIRRRYTKKRLAEELGVSSRTIQNYEAGTPAPDDAMLSRIALLLNFPRSFFFLEEDMPVISEHAASFRALSKMSAGTRACALSVGANAFRLNEWMDARFKLPQAALPDLSDLSPEDAALGAGPRPHPQHDSPPGIQGNPRFLPGGGVPGCGCFLQLA